MQTKTPNPLNPTGAKFDKPAPQPVAANSRSLPAKLLIVVLSLVITIGGWRAMIIDADIKQAVAQERAAAEQRAQAAEDAAAAAPPPDKTDVTAEVQPTAQPVPTLRVVAPSAPEPVPAPLPARRPRARTRSSK